jgi:hypothetical protein
VPWDKVLAALAALFKALEPYMPGLVAFLAGRQWQKDSQAAKDLKRVENANRAAAGIDALPDADVMRELKKRGMYHVSGK